MKKTLVILSILMAIVALAVVVLSIASAGRAVAQGGDEPVFALIKKTGNPTVTVGEVFTITLVVSPTSLTSQMTQTVPFTITDHNNMPAFLDFVTSTITATAGTAYWDPVDYSVRWNSQVISTSPVQTATFQVLVKSSGALTQTMVFTNYAYMEVGDYPGILPGSLPGSLPGEVPGSVPFPVPGDSRVVWDNFAITPLAVTFSLSPSNVMATTPFAIEVYTLTITNNNAAVDTFTWTYIATNTSALPWTVQMPPSVTVPAGLSAMVNVTVEIPADEVNWVIHTLIVTATSQNHSTGVAATLTTWTGGYWDPGLGSYVGCRFDMISDGSIELLDLLRVSDVYGSADPFVDFNHDTVIELLDLLSVSDRYGSACVGP